METPKNSVQNVAAVATAVIGTVVESCRVRFAAVVGSRNAKAPCYRASVYLTGPFKGLVLEAPIFKDDKGTYSVSMPGGRFAALKPANQIVRHGEQDYELTSFDPDGAIKANNWEPKIKGALLAYLHSVEAGKPQPEQSINLA